MKGVPWGIYENIENDTKMKLTEYKFGVKWTEIFQDSV
jgi:hypothetical protein